MKILLKPKNLLIITISIYLCVFLLTSCNTNNARLKSGNTNSTSSSLKSPLANIPKYSGKDILILNENIPNFNSTDLTTKTFEIYSSLDSLGRCGVAYANIGQTIMPTQERESISSVTPSGWHSVTYDIINGKYLYNRCHLIGFQLTAENANERNIITGTRYLNVELMLPYENSIADYITKTNNHVLYRVTPHFKGNNLVPTGVQIEAKSVEDMGKAIQFNVFLYNIQPGIIIDYTTGNSSLSGDKIYQPPEKPLTTGVIRGNSNTKIYHCPGQSFYDEMSNSKYLVNFNTENDAKAAGYRKSKK